jgi:NADH-quinone oxidoreductase subunit L
MYSARWLSADYITRLLRPIHTTLVNRYWTDELYEEFIGERLLNRGLFGIMKSFDSGVIDGVVNGVAGGIAAAGKAVKRMQSGQLQLYGLLLVIGVLAIALWLILS